MRLYACLVAILVLTGCQFPNRWGVVNNTRYTLVVTQDGAPCAKLAPGKTVALPQTFGRTDSMVGVTAYDGEIYIGADTYIFSYYRTYLWQIDRVERQGGYR
jgi:hypothetical protein